MKTNILNRNIFDPIIWTGDLNDDCTANWAGLMLRAEWMDDDYWWWCVYDMLTEEENQIDSSNEYEQRFIGGKVSREKAEEIARTYLKDKLINIDTNPDFYQISDFISDLKVLGATPIETMMLLKNKFNINLSESRDLVFDSKDWEGARELSEKLTQEFLNVSAEIADKVEFVDGKVSSITFDLTKDIQEDNQTQNKKYFWNRIKSKFK
ncbi:hypothetical protein [Flavobacterium chungangense]|uniref:Uncharacterized protein n=1 Tax=Flavobacterium chungangense TaxID=554283 RepID=A0A6V6ZF65_9FLAO|nr:hypothetical protein [Flavobacterium chungangense]CAD0009522.1 hypothetical protein FLACHUCJ7_04275 [Flavobacterium chungangense]